MLKDRLIEIAKTFWLELGCVLLLVLLLAKNPFSIRTLIPNLEPFPDTFHYIVSARSFLHGFGFVFEREGRAFATSVPTLYPLMLSPFLMIKDDPRMFYIANVLLAFGSLLCMFSIVRTIFPHRMTQVAVLMLYVMNYYTSWYPQWAMAENLSLLLILFLLHLFVQKPSAKNACIAAWVGILIYGVKFALGPLAVSWYAVFFVRYAHDWWQQGHKKLKLSDPLAVFVYSSIGGIVTYSLYDILASGRNIYKTVWDMLSMYVIESRARSQAAALGTTEPDANFLSFVYFWPNLRKHWISLNGGWTQILWDFTPLLPQWIASLSWIGLLMSWMYGKLRWISLSLLTLVLAEVLFMSTFYAFDMRYVMFAAPFMMIGVGLGFESLWYVFQQKKIIRVWWYGLVAVFIVAYLITNAMRIKSVVSINLRYAETPWWHISVQSTIEYINTHEFAKKPVVISAIPPFFFDFYSKQNFTLLPLSPNQEFRSHKPKVWGAYDYDNLIGEYTRLIKEGYPVLLMNYGLGNEQYLIQDYQKILQSFEVKEVKPGCYSLCTISQLSLKKGAK